MANDALGSASSSSPAVNAPQVHSPLLKSVLSNWAGLGLNLAVAFFMAPYTVSKLGEVQYGIWALVLQLTGYMGVFDVGIRSALVRFVARAVARNDEDALSETLSTTFLLYCGLALLVLVLGTLTLLLVLPVLEIPAMYAGAARSTFILAALTLALGFPLGMFQSALAGASRWDLNNAVFIGVLLVRTALVLYLLYAGYGVVALATVHLATSVLGWGAGTVLAHRLLRFRLRIRDATRTILRPIVDHSWNSMLISLANRINYQVDTIVIAAFLPIHYVTVYVIGYELNRYFRELLNSATQVIAPVVGGLDARDEKTEMRSLVLRGGKFTALFGYFGATMLILIGPQFIGVWMGQQYIETSGLVLQIVALSLFASATAYTPSHSLFGLGRHRVNVWCTAAEAALNLGASLYLVQRIGIYGVAAGTLVGASIVRGFIFPAAYLKILGITWKDHLRGVLIPALVPGALLAVALYPVVRGVAIDSYPRLLAAGIYGAAVFAAAAWRISLSASEREHLRTALGHLPLLRRAADKMRRGDA